MFMMKRNCIVIYNQQVITQFLERQPRNCYSICHSATNQDYGTFYSPVTVLQLIYYSLRSRIITTLWMR